MVSIWPEQDPDGAERCWGIGWRELVQPVQGVSIAFATGQMVQAGAEWKSAARSQRGL